MKLQHFLYTDSAWQDKYKAYSDARYDSFKISLNLLAQMPKDIFVLETGCQRGIDDWGGGCSTKVFMDFLQKHWYIYENMHHELVSVDISLPNIKLAYNEVEKYIEAPHVNYVPILGDSHQVMQNLIDNQKDVALLQQHEIATQQPYKLSDSLQSTRFDMIYLDSVDADLNDEAANNVAQEHQLKEAQLAQDLFNWDNLIHGYPLILLLDDNRLPFGGKTRLTKEYLLDTGWLHLYDWQQSLFIRVKPR